MARVAQPSTLIRAGPTQSGLDQGTSKSSKHKIVLESVTQEKKKLRSVLSFKAEPPKGYTFIPAGNPELTNALKEFARKDNYEIYAVSTTPHQRAHDLSQQVHRIGFHFPSVVVAQVCAHYGIVLTSAGTVVAEDESQSFQRRSKRLKAQAAAQEQKDQITINTEARDTIRDLFPNIPDNDLNQIIKTAFQKGQGKVGTAVELSLIRRAQLAVVAHIRHVYTFYDKLLRQTHYRDARNAVEKPTLRKLVEWRGDDENGKQVLEDVFREVVVISDDEDISEDEDEDVAMNEVRDVSVEIVSSNTKADHFNLDPLVLEEPVFDRELENYYPFNSKRLSDPKHLASSGRKERILDKDKANRRGFSRYQAWNEAREEYRANPADALAPNERTLTYSAPEVLFNRPAAVVQGSAYRPERPAHEAYERYHYQDTPVTFANNPPNTFRAEDGTLYERIVKDSATETRQLLNRPRIYETRDSGPDGKVRSLPVARDTYIQNRTQGVELQNESILPSIEGPTLATAPSQSRAVSGHRSSYQSAADRVGISSNRVPENQIEGIEFLDLTEEIPHLQKRRRLDDTHPEMSKDARTSTVTQNLPSQQQKPEYISLLSPSAQYSQPSYSSVLSPSRHQEPHGRSNSSSFAPTRQDTLVFPSPANILREGESSLARPPAGRLSTLNQLQSHENLRPPISSPRTDDESISFRRLRSALPGGAAPVDQGIQQYRAFRARERQDRALRRPSGRGVHRVREGRDVAGDATRANMGHVRELQVDGAEASCDVSHHYFPSRRLSREFVTVDDSNTSVQQDGYRLTREMMAERLPLRRRSASPTQYSNSRVESVRELPQPRIQQLHERAGDYLSMDWDRAPLREDRLKPVIVRPSGRHEARTYNSTRYLPDDRDQGQHDNRSIQRSYAQL